MQLIMYASLLVVTPQAPLITTFGKVTPVALEKVRTATTLLAFSVTFYRIPVPTQCYGQFMITIMRLLKLKRTVGLLMTW